MAIINSYPKKTTPADGDLFVITDSEQTAPNKNRTKSLSASDLKAYTQTGVGTVTSVALTETGTALAITGSPITSSGTINIAGAGTSSQVVLGDLSLATLPVDGVTSVALTMPAAFSVAGSPITSSGTFTVNGAGNNTQYVDGTGALQSFSDTASNTVARLIPFVTTASPGGSETYTALNNIVKIGWSGGNGIYVINLPSATAIPYRVIRFVTNGTYPGGGAHKVRFTATGGETIDGAAFFETSKVYEGIAAWSTGTEWVIIQAKAH